MILFNLDNDFVLSRLRNSLVRIAAIELTFRRERCKPLCNQHDDGYPFVLPFFILRLNQGPKLALSLLLPRSQACRTIILLQAAEKLGAYAL
jgi:hypothetical protein